jgi:hypothetical protein
MGEHVPGHELAHAHQDIPDQTALLVRNNLDVKKGSHLKTFLVFNASLSPVF